jgi:hypothetical protein
MSNSLRPYEVNNPTAMRLNTLGNDHYYGGTQSSGVIPLQKSPYGPMETAYQSCGPQVIPVALGPPSKVIGHCAQVFPGQRGVCVGAFLSNWVDVAEPMAADCLYRENHVKKVTKMDPGLDHSYATGAARERYHAQSSVPLSDWGPCSSYGSYSACANCLGPGNGGNSLLGEYGQSWCQTKSKFDPPTIPATCGGQH